MIKEIEDMCIVRNNANSGPSPIPEDGKYIQAKEIKDICGLTHGVGWCAPQQGACKLTLNIKDGIIEEAKKDGDIGIENASPKSILAALERVRTESTEKREEFKQVDLIRNGLIGNEDASHRRDELGKILGIGYGNAKQRPQKPQQ